MSLSRCDSLIFALQLFGNNLFLQERHLLFDSAPKHSMYNVLSIPQKTENLCIWNESKLLHLPGPVTIQGERWKYADVFHAWKCITFPRRPASTIKFSFNSDNCSVSLCLPGWKGTTCYVFQDQFAILNLQLSNTDVDIFWHTAKANT